MPIKMSTSDQEGYGNGVNILLHGASGCGKTHALGTFRDQDILILSTERKMLTLKGRQIPVLNIDDLKDFEDAIAFIENPANVSQFSIIAIDSITEIAEKVLDANKKTFKDARQAYTFLADKVLAILRRLLAVPKHIVVVAKQEVLEAGMGAVKFVPSMPGKNLRGKLPYLFDAVLVARTAKNPEGADYFFIQTTPDNQYDAKGLDCLYPAEYPDLSAILLKILGA